MIPYNWCLMPPGSPAVATSRYHLRLQPTATSWFPRSGLRDVSRHTVQRELQLNRSKNRPSKEINFESIRALEEQIKDHEMAITKLKRGRNSLLNVSRLPPEVLGDIFRWNVIIESTSRRSEGSHNFVLVCHYWSEVALNIPQLWDFWGDDLQDWKQWHHLYPTVPLDLVLNEEDHGPSMTACEIHSGIVPHETPYDGSTSFPRIQTSWTPSFPPWLITTWISLAVSNQSLSRTMTQRPPPTSRISSPTIISQNCNTSNWRTVQSQDGTSYHKLLFLQP